MICSSTVQNITGFDWVKLLETTLPAILAIFGIVVGNIINNRATRKSLLSQRKNPEINEIRSSLFNFYQPMLLLLNKNRQLYDLFKLNKPQDFRTLTSLLNGVVFEGNDVILLKEIIAIDKEINELIINNKGLIKENELNTVLSNASVHFTIIDLAYNKKIIGEPERFVSYVYPRELQLMIEQEVVRLQTRLGELEKE